MMITALADFCAEMHPLGASLLRLVKKEARCQNREEEVEDEYAQNDAEAEEDEVRGSNKSGTGNIH